MTVHVALVVNEGFDWSAAVSAGAAVAQAVGAVVAIVYSGKLARDAAAREIAADAANVRRMAEADEAAERRRALEVEVSAAASIRHEVASFNAPLDEAISYGREAHREFVNFREQLDGTEMFGLSQAEPGVNQVLLTGRSDRMISEARTPAAASAIKRLVDSLAPFPAGTILTNSQWNITLDSKISASEAAIAAIEALRR